VTLDATLGFDLVTLEDEKAYGRVEVEDRHLQALGVVHGGVYAALAESLVSHATARAVMPQGMAALGMTNETSLFRPVSTGTLHANAERLHRGRTTWVWDVRIIDGESRTCAASRITVAVRPA
jgi:1,4-dihydroxy-2-naphthoyl-CoA hydrolase